VIHILASFGLLLTVLGFSGGAWHPWDSSNAAIIPAGRYLVLVGMALAAASVCYSYLVGYGLPSHEAFTEKRVWSFGLIIIFLSDWLVRPWGLFKGPAIRGEILVGAMICYLLMRKQLWSRFFSIWPLIVSGLLIWSFYLAANGMLLFSDDHPMFLFRLKLLKENFPNIPFWSPLWNAGFDARDFFATGALNAYLLSAPLVHLFPVETVYPIIISGLLWVFAPLCLYLAARAMQLSRIAAAISATLSLCSGLFWFRWALKYGTIGFITSAALLPLVLALAVNFLGKERPQYLQILALSVTTSLMLLWSPSGIALIPVFLIAVPKLPKLIRSKRHALAIVLTIAINLPWMTMMWKVSNVGKFLNAHHSATVASDPIPLRDPSPALSTKDNGNGAAPFRHKAGSLDLKKALNQWQSNAAALNPLLLVFAVPALIAFAGAARWYLIGTSIWLFCLGTIGVSLKPQLELDRMIVIASIVITIPIGQYLSQLFSSAGRGLSWRLAASCAAAFVLISPFGATAVVLNRSDDTYTFATKELYSLIRILSNNSSGGRVMFSGCVLHQLNGGHLAPLPMWADTPMIASSYAHNIWRYEQPIPEHLISKGDGGITEFLDLMNVTVVTAHEPTWIEYFRKRPEDYQQIWRGEVLFVFKRLNYSASYTITGALSDLEFNSRSISFIPSTSYLTLKFRYFPFLRASGCNLSSAPSEAGFEMISLSKCTPGTRVTVDSVPPIQRLFGAPHA
jgi:hypothetical protein